MTNTEKITAIENKIRGECEWLMEKTIGCEVKILDEDNFPYSTGIYVSDKDIFLNGFHVGLYKRNLNHSIEILGHPIQLSDLLLTLKKYHPKPIAINNVTGEFMQCSWGNVSPNSDDEKWFACNQHWDFTKSFKENLEQSPELVEFLFNLIVK